MTGLPLRRAGLAAAALAVVLAGCGGPSGHHHRPPGPKPTPTPSVSGGPGTCHATADLRPDPVCTPSATNPAVTQQTIAHTICVSGWTATVRPPQAYTDALKVRQIRAYGYADTTVADYEEDHLLPLDLGGNPTDPRNLWPEPRKGPAGRTAAAKDTDEASAVRAVCAGTVGLDAERSAFLVKWGPVPGGR